MDSGLKGKAVSIWIEDTEQTNYPALKDGQQADIVIAGGGLAGIQTAYYLAKEGLNVAVIEAFQIATGTSGNTTAKLTSLHGLIYDYLLTTFGEEKAKVYADSNEWAIKETESIIQQEHLECNYIQGDAYTYTNDDKFLEKIEKETAAAQKLGLPATIVNNLTYPFPVNTGIKFTGQAQYHPRKYLLQLAKKVTGLGGAIYENTKVLDIKETTTACEVLTDKGTIKAKKVIIATNYPIYDKGMFFARMDQWRSYAYAVKINGKMTNDMYLGVGQDWLSLRSYHEGTNDWLIVGGESHPADDNSNSLKHFKNLEKIMTKYLPVRSIDYRWAAQDSAPLDRVPFIGKEPFSKNVYVITGFYKWGLTKSVIAAKIITDLIQDRKNDWLDLYSPARIKLQPGKLLEMGKGAVKGYGAHVKQQAEPVDIEKGGGKVITQDKEKVAVYKDDDGQLHVVSAVCTHLGCIVDWNGGEKTWDCPCHGSRFTKEGKVIHGPATKDLPAKEI